PAGTITSARSGFNISLLIRSSRLKEAIYSFILRISSRLADRSVNFDERSNNLLIFPPVPMVLTGREVSTCCLIHFSIDFQAPFDSLPSSNLTDPNLNDLEQILTLSMYKFSSVLPPPTSI